MLAFAAGRVLATVSVLAMGGNLGEPFFFKAEVTELIGRRVGPTLDQPARARVGSAALCNCARDRQDQTLAGRRRSG